MVGTGALRSRRYRLLASAGLALLALSLVTWGRGWWSSALMLLGLALIQLPYSRTSPSKDVDPRPEPPSGNWTGAR